MISQSGQREDQEEKEKGQRRRLTRTEGQREITVRNNWHQPCMFLLDSFPFFFLERCNVKTDLSLFWLSDSVLQLPSTYVNVQLPCSFSGGLSPYFLLPFTFLPQKDNCSYSVWFAGRQFKLCHLNWNWLALRVRMPISISVTLYSE